jgi:anti-sigma factor RsiW
MDDQRLQRYFDGALDDAERREVEAALTPEDHERLAVLGEMRRLLADGLGAESGAVDLWPGIEAELARSDEGKAAKQASVRRWRSRVRARSWAAGLGFVAAALGAFLVMARPWHPTHASNGCDVESLEVAGAVATVLTIPDSPHRGDGETTVIWMEED